MLADLLILQETVVAADGDAIIARIDDAIGYGYVAAAVDINAVAVEEGGGIAGLETADGYVFTAVEEASPAGLIADGDIFHQNALTLDEAQELTGTAELIVLCLTDRDAVQHIAAGGGIFKVEQLVKTGVFAAMPGTVLVAELVLRQIVVDII